MGKNVNQLSIGDIGPAGNIRRSGKKDPVIADNPLQPVIRNNRHMVALLNSKRHQGSRKIETGFIEIPKTGRLKPTGGAFS